MPGAAEAAAAGTEFSAVGAAAVDTISQKQTITFTRYVRTVLPLDGFVFWVRQDLLTPSALLNSSRFAGAPFNQARTIATPAETVTVSGSLHYTTSNRQDESEGFAVNQVIFSAEKEIEALNTLDPTTILIGTIDDIRFAFSSRGRFYRQSGLYHYRGDAIYPAMESQIIDFPEAIDLRNVVVSNSLPIWLTLNKFCPMFPSYLVPDNIDPPWCSVHVDPGSTHALQMAPFIDPDNGSHIQLVAERVRLTVYGLRNFNIMDFLDYVQEYSLNTEAFGITNMPVPRDEKWTQAELNILAMKKTIDFEVNYYQSRVRDIGRQYIKSAFMAFLLPKG